MGPPTHPPSPRLQPEGEGCSPRMCGLMGGGAGEMEERRGEGAAAGGRGEGGEYESR